MGGRSLGRRDQRASAQGTDAEAEKLWITSTLSSSRSDLTDQTERGDMDNPIILCVPPADSTCGTSFPPLVPTVTSCPLEQRARHRRTMFVSIPPVSNWFVRNRILMHRPKPAMCPTIGHRPPAHGASNCPDSSSGACVLCNELPSLWLRNDHQDILRQPWTGPRRLYR